MSEPPSASSPTADDHDVPQHTMSIARLALFLIPIPLVAVLGWNIEELLLGWIYFPLRTIPGMTVDRPSVIIGLLSVIMFVFGLHWTACRTLRRSNRADAAETKRWTWRSTFICAATLFVLFATGTALVGATHQVVWLFSGRDDARSAAVSVEDLGLLAQARDAALRTQARGRLKQLGLAFHNFHDIFGAFPSAGTMTQDGELLHGWPIAIGPGAWFQAPDDMDYGRGWRSPANERIYKCQISLFVNPSQAGTVFDDDGFGLCHLAGNVHVLPIRTIHVDTLPSGPNYRQAIRDAYFQRHGMSIEQITDGTSNTILLGTVAQNFKPWGHPANVRDPALGVNRSPEGFGGPPAWHGGQFLMCDGSVRFLSKDTDLSLMKALATPAGGETVIDYWPQ